MTSVGAAGASARCPQHFGVGAGHVAEEREAQELRPVAELPAILDAWRLVLVIVVLERLREADGRKPLLDEGPVVAAAAESVEAEDEPHGFPSRDFLRGAREVARRRIDAVRPTSGEEPDAVRPPGSEVRSHDVVVEKPSHRVALLLQVLEKPFAAQQALLLSRHGGKEQRRPVGSLREKPRALDRDRDSGRIVVGAWRVGRGIHHRGRHRVVVAGDEKDRLRKLRIRARQQGHHIFEADGPVVRAGSGGLEAVDDDLKTPSRALRDRLEPRDDAIPAAADAAATIVPGGERVPRPAGHELLDRRAHRLLVHFRAGHRAGRGRDRRGAGLAAGRFGRVLSSDERREQSRRNGEFDCVEALC